MKRRVALFAGIFFAIASFAFAQNDMQTLAVVKANRTETITLKQLKNRVNFVQKQYESYGIKLTPEQRAEALQSLINEKLLVQAATKEGLSITDSQVNATFLNTFSQQLGTQVTEAQLEEIIQQQLNLSLNDYMLQSTGMGLNDYKAYLKNQLIIQQYVYSKCQSEMAAISVTDADIRSAYELNRKGFMWNDMVRLFLVIVPKGSDSTAARSLANQVRAQYSKNPSSETAIVNEGSSSGKYQAGAILVEKTSAQATQLGWTYDKIIELFSKDTNFISEVTETPNDFQFYVVSKKYGAKLLEIGDCIQPETTITVYDYIKQNLTSQKQQQYFADAAESLAASLDTPENVERKKTGDELLQLLNW